MGSALHKVNNKDCKLLVYYIAIEQELLRTVKLTSPAACQSFRKHCKYVTLTFQVNKSGDAGTE